MSKKWKIIILMIIFVIVVFLITSGVFALNHNQSILQEWQSWFGIVEKIPVIDV